MTQWQMTGECISRKTWHFTERLSKQGGTWYLGGRERAPLFGGDKSHREKLIN